MGDRTTVYLTVLAVHKELAEVHIDDQACDEEAEGLHVKYTFYDVNYGNLPFLDAMDHEGIPYDSTWESGDEYGEGTQSGRFTHEGIFVDKTVYGSSQGVPLDTLIPLLGDHAALVACIKKCQEEISVLPWENQEEYSKLYRARKLINA